MSTLDHTIEMKKGPFMRLFLWTYRPNLRSLNTCWLFWGFLFMPLMLPVVSLVRGAMSVFRPIGHAIDAKFPDKPRNPKPISYEPKKKKEGKFLPAVSHFFSTVWFKLAPVWPWVGKFIGLAVTLFAAYLLIFVVDYSGFFEFLLRLALTSVAVVAILCVLFFLFWLLFEKWDVGRAVKKGGKAFHNHTCANIRFKDEAGEFEPTSYGGP